MSLIIKAAEAETDPDVRPILFAAREGMATGKEAVLAQDPAKLQLQADLAEARQALSDLQTASVKAIDDARREERASVLAAIKRDDSERLERLKSGVADALKAQSAALAGLEPLALAIAQTALEKLLVAPETQRSLLSQLITRHVGLLRRDTILDVRFCGEDVASGRAAEAIRQAGLGTGVQISADPALKAGDVVFSTRQGEIDLSLLQQWDEMTGLMRRLAEAPRS